MRARFIFRDKGYEFLFSIIMFVVLVLEAAAGVV